VSHVFKGTLTRDFRPLVFFHQTTSPGPLIQGSKPFLINSSFEFAKIFDPVGCTAVCCHHCDMHSGIIDPAVTYKEVSMTRSALAIFKGNIYRKNIHRQFVPHYIYNVQTKNMGLTEDRFAQIRRFRCPFLSCANSKPYSKRA
jgi:hypothetical protein